LRASSELGLKVTPELTVTLGTYFSINQISMMERGYSAAATLLRSRQRFTALLAFNDKSAIGAIRAIQDQGLQVPGDISVMGVDDLQFSAYFSPRLTTIRQPLRSMGAAAASTLLREIHGEAVPEETVLQPELVVRESTGPASKEE
jgi:LacI family transcriptional regulator